MYGGLTELQLNWQGLSWPAQEPGGPFISPRGTANWSGLPGDFTFGMEARLQADPLPPVRVQVAGAGSQQQVQVEHLQLDALDGRIEGRAELQLQPHLAWQARLRARDINPEPLQPGWPGRLAAQLELQGEMAADGLHLQGQLAQLAGELRGYPIAGQGRMAWAAERLDIEQLELTSGSAQLALQAQLDQHWRGHWQLKVPDLASLWPGGQGRVAGHGRIEGPQAAPRVTASLEAQSLAVEQHSLAALTAELDLDSAAQGVWQGVLEARELQSGDWKLARLQARLEGRAHQHRLQLNAGDERLGLRLTAQGGWQQEQWRGEVSAADWVYPPLGRWHLQAPAALQLSRAGSRLDKACWQQQPALLCLLGDGAEASGWRGELSLRQWPLDALKAYLPAGHGVSGGLDAELQAAWQPDQAWPTGRASLTLAAGELRFAPPPAATLAYTGGQLQATLQEQALDLDFALALVAQDRLSGSARITQLDQENPRLDGRLQGRVHELGFVQTFSAAVEELKGELQLDLEAHGTLAQPQLQGSLTLQQGAVLVPAAGIRLQDMELRIWSDAEPGLKLSGGLRSGPAGKLGIEGRLLWPQDARQWRLALAAQGQQLLVADTPQAQVRVSPDLKLAAQAGRVDLSGTLVVPYARIQPRDFGGAQGPSGDVVRLDQEQGKAPRWDLYSDVRLELGEDVRFKGFGLQGFVRGALGLRDEPRRPTRARGVLAVHEGRYRMYGQDLNIATGRLLFNDSPLDNPGLDIRATRKVGEVLAGIRVGGVLLEPELNLYSDPAMSDSDTLSYLLLGRPLAQASGSEGATLMQAASAAGLSGGEWLAEQIGSRFGLDEVSVGGDNLEQTALSVGKYLSPRLYVNYSVGLLQPINTLRVRYQMSRRWAVQTESGIESGADLLYSLER